MIALAGVLAAAVLLGWMRLAVRRRAGGARGWRVAVLAVAQPVLAGLLYLTLAPPPVTGPGAATLVVATRGARGGAGVTLPEAHAIAGAERAPDLATALRRHPETRTVRIVGEGLEPRDRDAARGVAVMFTPTVLPAGLVALAPPGPIAPGAAFRVGADVAGVPGATVELLDPGGSLLDRAAPGAAGHVVLTGQARVPGLALFAVRVRGRAGVVEAAAVPVRTVAPPPVRALFLAGSADPEVKQWRRWAADAGLVARTRVTLGAGLVLGDPVPPLGEPTLAKVDVLVLDERSWAGLSGSERAGVAAAVRGGLGVVLRLTGPLDDGGRAGARALGATLAGATATAPVRLTADPGLVGTRRVVSIADAVPMLRDAGGTALSGWRAVGRGRVGVWPLVDAAGLVTAGQGARYGELWSEAIGAVARAQAADPPRIDALPDAAVRVTICALSTGASVVAPDGVVTPLIVDRGCAGYWPRGAGWHAVRQASADWPFYIYPAGTLPHVREAERRDATLLLTTGAADARVTLASPRPGPSWPWFLGFLVVAGATWWFERSRLGRRGRVSAPPL